MEEREGFIKKTKIALTGILNGIVGSTVYQYIISIIIAIIVGSVVSANNPNASETELNELANAVFASFPYSILVSCLSSVATLIVFIFIIKFKDFKELCKKAINSKTLKYGVVAAIVMMLFSIIYNNLVINIFNLESMGNANQEGVINLIGSNIILSFLTIVVLAPIIEELTHRYCIFGELYKRNKVLAYLTSGVIFMLMHSVASYGEAGGFNEVFFKELIYLPPYLLSGLTLCYVYDKTGNIGSSVTAHFVNNLVSFLLVVTL